MDPGEITRWLIDTRTIWPGTKIWDAPGAAEAMGLISIAEQNVISGKMFIQDARMSLASALVKRLYISKTLGIPWKDVILARKGDPRNGKPCAVDVDGRPIEGIDFNVSHQAGLVALIGWNGRQRHSHNSEGNIEGSVSTSSAKDFDTNVMVGVDIVCVHERNDDRTIEEEGLESWVDTFDFVFSDEERFEMKFHVDSVTLTDGRSLEEEDLGRHDRCTQRNKDLSVTTKKGEIIKFNSNRIIEAKLRRFYAYFCYKEAYIKLAGEALLAPWLKELEFFNVRSPKPADPPRINDLSQWGEEVTDVEVHLRDKEVSDVRMNLTAFDENHMLSTAIQGRIDGIRVPPFSTLHLQSDIMDHAHQYMNTSPSIDH
jgi:4'-phosphopantetheinyl transferase